MNNDDLRTFILDLLSRHPNMRGHRVLEEIRKFDKLKKLIEENYYRQLMTSTAKAERNFYANEYEKTPLETRHRSFGQWIAELVRW